MICLDGYGVSIHRLQVKLNQVSEERYDFE